MWPCPRLSTDILSTRFSPPRMFSSSVTRARMCDTFVYLLPRPCCSRIDRFQVSTLGGWKASRGNRSSNPPLGELLPLHGLIIFSTSLWWSHSDKGKEEEERFSRFSYRLLRFHAFLCCSETENLVERFLVNFIFHKGKLKLKRSCV